MGIYSSLLLQHPVKTKAVTCGLISGLGDGICQHITLGRHEDWWRTVHMGTTAGSLLAPLFHYYLMHVFPLIKANNKTLLLAKRVAVHSLLITPLCSFLILFGFGTLQAQHVAGGVSKV